MLPFTQHIPNQPSSAPPGASMPQQVPGSSSNNMLPNLMQINSQMGFVNPQSQIPFNNHMGNNNRPPGLMNIPQFHNLQNGHLGNSVLGSVPQGQSLPGFGIQNFGQNLNVPPFSVNGQLGNLNNGNQAQFFGQNLLNMAQQLNQASGFQNGQFGWQNQVQNMNQLGNMPVLNPSQVAALAQLMGCANQVGQGMIPQSTGFVGNAQQLSVVRPHSFLQQPNLGQQLPVGSQQIQNFSLAQSNTVSSIPQHSQSPSLQGNLGQRHGIHMSSPDQHQNKKFMKNPRRDASNQRFQKSQDQYMQNNKGKHNFSDKDGGKGNKSSNLDNSANQSKSGKRRSLSVFYTEKEIQQWCEERKKNYPSKTNVEKKLTHKQANADFDVEEEKLRRQQLKDVLAKQVELGFEVPEIPSHYLLDPEDQCHREDGNKKPLNNGRFQNRFNKRGRFNQSNNRFDKKRGTEGNGSSRRNERFAKRKRVEGDDLSKTPLSIRKPTLLEKLLSSDIKRDNCHLLQALQFMVMNSFFKDWPEKPLDFPKVIVKETELENEVIAQKPLFLNGELVSSIEDQDATDDRDGENDGCQEEGEITD